MSAIKYSAEILLRLISGHMCIFSWIRHWCVTFDIRRVRLQSCLLPRTLTFWNRDLKPFFC